MTNCFGRSGYAIKTSRQRHFMQFFTEIIFKECPWPTKTRRPHASPICKKVRGATFASCFVYLTRKMLLYVGDTNQRFELRKDQGLHA